MKAHFCFSIDPISFWPATKQALCGAEVANPEAVMMHEIVSLGLPEFFSTRDCWKCVQAVQRQANVSNDRMYLYGIVPAQEHRLEESA